MVPAEIRKAFVPIKKPTKGKQQSRKSGSESERGLGGATETEATRPPRRRVLWPGQTK